MDPLRRQVLQRYLDNCWEVVDKGSSTVAKMTAWLRDGGHRTIDDESAKTVADMMDKNVRKL